MSKFNNKSHGFTRVILSIFVLGFLPLSYSSANTAANTSSDNSANLPLDVVLVMDSSGSMKHTDPQELRKPAAKLLISLLGDNDRASVVSFSDQGYPVAFLTPVKGKVNEAKLFTAVDRISNKGGYTNLLGAVEGAMRVIRRDPLPNRKSIIVLMTDGKMDLGDSAKNQSKSDTLFMDLIPQLKGKNIELHTIAFTDQSDKAYLEKLARVTGGKFNLAHTDKQLHDVYTSIFEQNKQPDMLFFDGENFTIDNAIKAVTIVGAKDSKDVLLSLLTPGGERIAAANKPNNIKWFTAQAFDLITIQNPQPGQWQIKSSNGKNKAYIITDLKFQLEVEPQEVAIGKGMMVKAWLQDHGKTIAKPSRLSIIKMVLQVHTPNGNIHQLDMQPQVKEDGSGEWTGIYTKSIAPSAEGRYKIEVFAYSSAFSRARNTLVKVFDPNAMPKTVSPPTSAQPQRNVSRALPNIGPVIERQTAESLTAYSGQELEVPKPQISMPEERQPDVTESSTSKQHSAELYSSEQHSSKQPSSNLQIAEHSVEQPVADTSPLTTSAEQSDEANHGEQKHKQANSVDSPSNTPIDKPKKEGPNIMKALGMFLIINGGFAMFGGIGFLIYRKSIDKIPVLKNKVR